MNDIAQDMPDKFASTKHRISVDRAVDQNETVYPMIPAWAAHNEIVLGPEGRDDGRLDKNQV